jgi:cysteine desulfurase
VDAEGRVGVASVEKALRADTILVSIMAANNEIGTLQPVAEIGAVCAQRGIKLHTDAVQWFGKQPFHDLSQFNADLVSICGHKFHGPKGAGALYVKSPLLPDPIIFGGGHENERRAGTENLAGIVGLVEAMERFIREPVFSSEIKPLADRLRNLVGQVEGARFVGSESERLHNTVAMVVKNTDSISLLAGLDMEGICASSGSACSAGSIEPSHVIAALGVERDLQNSLVRFSLGRETKMEEVQYLESVLPTIIRRAQRRQ